MKETKEIMWCVVNNNHPSGRTPYRIIETLSSYRKNSIKKFVDGSTNNWKYWYQKYNFRCVKVEVTINEIEKK